MDIMQSFVCRSCHVSCLSLEHPGTKAPFLAVFHSLRKNPGTNSESAIDIHRFTNFGRMLEPKQDCCANWGTFFWSASSSRRFRTLIWLRWNAVPALTKSLLTYYAILLYLFILFYHVSTDFWNCRPFSSSVFERSSIKAQGLVNLSVKVCSCGHCWVVRWWRCIHRVRTWPIAKGTHDNATSWDPDQLLHDSGCTVLECCSSVVLQPLQQGCGRHVLGWKFHGHERILIIQ